MKGSQDQFIQKNPKRSAPPITYSIGLYEGTSPFDLKPSSRAKNPIVSRPNFAKGLVNFVADPFGMFHNGEWFLFYEILPSNSRKGEIYVSKSKNALEWETGQLVLSESFHLSYPQVFQEGASFFMIPESFEAGEVRLYESQNFPFDWKLKKVLLPFAAVDTTVINYGNTWWLFSCDAVHDHNRLRLFYSNSLEGDWTEHPESPIRSNDQSSSRPAGKLLFNEGKLYRFAQNCAPFYGHSVNVFEIEILNFTEYKEIELEINPILEGGSDLWNKLSMHHIDLHKLSEGNWIAFVDGRAN